MALATEESAISAAAAKLACEMSRAWLARPWGAGRTDRATIDRFHKAAVDGDSELVGRMLDDAGRFGVPVLLESRNSAGWTPLMWASWHAQVRPAAAPLLGRRAVLSSRNAFHSGSLRAVVQVPVIRRLVQSKCNVNASDRYGQSALSLAAESTSSSQEAAVTLLLDAGADTTQKGYEGKTPAEWAEETGNPRLAAHIRRAPTSRGRWMAAEQRLAMAKLLQQRLGRRSPLYPVVNRDVMEVVARWMPYTRRRDLVFERSAARSDNRPDKRPKLDPSFAHGSAQRGLRRRPRHLTNMNALQLGLLGANGVATHVEVDSSTNAADATPTDVRTVEQEHDSSSDEDCSSEVLDRYLECVDTLIERHGHQPRRYDSITVQVKRRRDKARAMHRDPNGRDHQWPAAPGVEWTQQSICCAHCALQSDSAATAGLDQTALQQHVLQEQGCTYTDFIVMISPAAETGLSTKQPASDRDIDHSGDASARSDAEIEQTDSLYDSTWAPQSPRQLPLRLEYDSVVACAPARSCMSLLIDAVEQLGILSGASIVTKLCCD
eukprot:COSAG02_NODE_1059_length_14871_cov_5.877208_6_plen_549_part_00